MKFIKYFSVIAILFLLGACTDKKKNDDIFDDFEGEKGIYMIKLPPVLFLNMIGQDNDDFDKDELGNIDLVKLLIYSREEATKEDTNQILQRMKSELNDYSYENIVSFNSSDAFISAYILENDEYVTDMMVLVKESQSLLCLGLSGKMNGEEIFNFASGLEYDNLYNFIDWN